MIYPWFDYCQRQAMTALNFFRAPASNDPWSKYWQVGPEFLARNAASAEPVAITLREALADASLEQRIVESDPFAAVSSYRRKGAPDRTMFVVLPHSGYAAAALRAFIDGLLELGTVVVTEWRDPRLIPSDLGSFGLLDQVALLERVLEKLDQKAIMIGLSQSGWPAVIAAERQAGSVEAMAVLGAPIDPTCSPSTVQEFLNAVPMSGIEQLYTSPVPDRYIGRGRKVFPALLQLWTHAGSSPMQYLDAQNGLINGILNASSTVQHDEMHRLCDVPAELFLDMMSLLRQSPRAILDDFAHGFDPARLVGLPLLTVEASADPLVGTGQTHALGGLLRSRQHTKVDVEGGDHIDLFVGQQFTNTVLSALRKLMAATAHGAKAG